jgi:hypothetical protein
MIENAKRISGTNTSQNLKRYEVLKRMLETAPQPHATPESEVSEQLKLSDKKDLYDKSDDESR